MKFPCIVYTLSGGNERRANDSLYSFRKRYTVTVISTDVDEGESWRPSARDDGLIESFLKEFPMSSYDRSFTSDNLSHTVFTLYFHS
jgi:hypothetical protein